ncbi:MAG: hypothetical protein GXO47_04600 [Chlorobi bacterium]|nr:hypothetical protein [Chlorobiota bacterium]
MKNIKLIFLAGVLVFLSYSCNDDDGYSIGDFWITIGNIEGTQDNFIVVTDNGERLFPSANMTPGYPVTDGDRLWVNFTILANAEENMNFDYYVKINYFKDILTKDIFILTPDNEDSIGHDPVWVKYPDNDVWIANNYLNIFFYYEGAPWKVHYINVVSDINNPMTPDSIPILELRHNKNGDYYTEPLLKGFVSINLTSLQKPDKDSITFVLRAIDANGEYGLDKEYTYKYTYSSSDTLVTNLTIQNIPAENVMIK